jgi:hypothetical protein
MVGKNPNCERLKWAGVVSAALRCLRVELVDHRSRPKIW